MVFNDQADSEDFYRVVVEEASVLAALYVGPEIRIQIINKLMLDAWGKDESVIGMTIREANPEWEGQPFFDYFDTVYRTGIEHVSFEERAILPASGSSRPFYYNFSYKPLKKPDGTVWAIVHTAWDVTEQVLAKKAKEESDKNFRNMVLQSPIASCIYNGPTFVLTVANKKMLELMGKTEEEAMNKPILEGLPEVKDEGFEEILKRVYTTGIAFEATETLASLPRNGKVEEVYVNFTYSPIRNAEGEISDILAIAYDVTDQVKAKMELKASVADKEKIAKDLREERERLNQILETMAEGVGIIDTTGNLIYANPMAKKILGIGSGEMLKTSYSENSKWQTLHVDGTPLPRAEHPMSVAIATGQVIYDREVSIQPVDGERFYLSINAAPIRNERGEIIAGVGSFMDVTQRRKLTQQKDEFISVASHELKTPLTSVKAGFQLLERYLQSDAGIPERVIKIANSTQKNLQKLSALVDDLLNVTKIEKGQFVLKYESFGIADLLNECCDHIRLAGTHEIEIIGDLTLIVYADRQKVDQVLVNLVNNAVKYSPNSDRVIINVEDLEDYVRISVKDFGIGIEPGKAERIFDRFYQVDSSGLQFSGLGLGLYISAEIVKQHGGEIGVDTAPGNGSTFWFTLPK